MGNQSIDERAEIEKQLKYHSHKRELLEGMLNSINNLIVFYETAGKIPDEEKRLLQGVKLAELKFQEMEVENEIKSSQQYIDQFLFRLQQSEEGKALVESIKANLSTLIQEAHILIRDERMMPQDKDILKGLLKNIENDGAADKFFVMLYQRVNYFKNLQGNQKRIITS